MFIYLNFINCVCLYLTNYNKISQSTIINSHYSNRFSTQICTRLHIRPLRVLQATMRTKLVKGPGGISAPAIRRPWNVMSHTLMHVARRSLNQKELVLVAIVHGRRSPCQLVAIRLARQYWHSSQALLFPTCSPRPPILPLAPNTNENRRNIHSTVSSKYNNSKNKGWTQLYVTYTHYQSIMMRQW